MPANTLKNLEFQVPFSQNGSSTQEEDGGGGGGGEEARKEVGLDARDTSFDGMRGKFVAVEEPH